MPRLCDLGDHNAVRDQLVIRLILIDIDGTLVGKQGVHATTWPALAAAQAAGARVALCTGRIGCGSALEYAQRVAPEGLHVFQSGAVISLPGAPAAYVSTLPAVAVRELVAISRRESEPIELYTERGFFLERNTELTRVHAHHLEMEPEVRDLMQIDALIARAQWVVHESRWPHFRELTLAIGGLDANPATAPWSPGTVFSNITRAGTSKVSAMRWLAEHHGIAMAEIAMIGDGENDLDAIGAAGLGIAMGNAPESVKRAAREIVGDVDAGGLAEAVQAAMTVR